MKANYTAENIRQAIENHEANMKRMGFTFPDFYLDNCVMVTPKGQRLMPDDFDRLHILSLHIDDYVAIEQLLKLWEIETRLHDCESLCPGCS